MPSIIPTDTKPANENPPAATAPTTTPASNMPAQLDKPNQPDTSSGDNVPDAAKPVVSDTTAQPPKTTNGSPDNADQVSVPEKPTSADKPSVEAGKDNPVKADPAAPVKDSKPDEKPAVDDDDDADDADYDVDADMLAAKAEEKDEDRDDNDEGAEGEGDTEGMESTGDTAMPDLPKGLVKSLMANGTLGDKPLHKAAAEGDLEKVKEMIHGEWKGDVNDLDVFHYTPLHFAAENGHADVCRVLVEAGGDVSLTTKMFGSTALHYAAFVGHEEALKTLLELGAEVDAVTEDLRTPLYQAALKGHIACVRALLAHDADPSITAIGGKTASDIAETSEIRDAIKEGPPAKRRKVNADGKDNTETDGSNADKKDVADDAKKDAAGGSKKDASDEVKKDVAVAVKDDADDAKKDVANAVKKDSADDVKKGAADAAEKEATNADGNHATA